MTPTKRVRTRAPYKRKPTTPIEPDALALLRVLSEKTGVKQYRIVSEGVDLWRDKWNRREISEKTPATY